MKFYQNLIFFAFVPISNGFTQSKSDWDTLYSKANSAEIKRESMVFQPNELDISSGIESYLDSVAQINHKSNRISGFRILLYSGNERDEATKTREKAYRIFHNADLYTNYQAPTFKVRLGNYYQRLDAFIALKKLEPLFPHAVIVQEIVNLKP